MINTYGANRRWMIPGNREHSHSMTQNIPGKQVLVRMCDCGKTTTSCHVDFFNVDFCNVDFLQVNQGGQLSDGNNCLVRTKMCRSIILSRTFKAPSYSSSDHYDHIHIHTVRKPCTLTIPLLPIPLQNQRGDTMVDEYDYNNLIKSLICQ